MDINIDIIQGSTAINKLIDSLNQIPNMDDQYMENLYFFIRKNQKAFHIHSYDNVAIHDIYQLLLTNNVISIMQTEYDIIVPWSEDNNRIIRYAVSYINFIALSVDKNDVPRVRLSKVVLMTDEEFVKKYSHNRLTQYALGSTYYVNAVRTEENIFKTHKCIICTGSFREIERLRSMLIEQGIPCANLNMDVLCISPEQHIEYLYRLIQGGMYLMELENPPNNMDY